MSSKVLGSDASRPRSGRGNVLAPSSDTRLNHDDALPTSFAPGQKRKHDAYAMEDLLKISIVVKPHPPKLSTKPRSLQPLMLLPRERLPLSCFDFASPLGDFQYARFYESTIKILDLEGRMGTRPVVLIARLETDKTVYALERHDANLYTLCKLGNWVDLERLSDYATVAYSKLMRPRAAPVSVNPIQPEATITPQLHKENKKRRLAIEAIQSLVKKPARSQSIALASQGPEIIQTPPPVENDVASQLASLPVPPEIANGTPETQAGVQKSLVPGPEDVLAQPTANDIFDNVRNQYFEALYHSMGSLAYFAKGPLSRARAAFHLDCDSNLDMNDLIDFLKSIVLTTTQIDKKYRETVPDIIAQMKLHIADSADEQGSKAKKKKPKKMKLGKDGLYPMEDAHVRKWWAVHKPQLQDNDSMMSEIPQEVRLQISCLRSRETQLQMILILELLALEPLRIAANANDSQLPGLPADDPLPNASKAMIKKRNKHNFPVLLDVHADRLSIWQSTSLDDVKMIDDSQTNQHREAQKSDTSTSDPLKDFCVDIIVPFFSSRLPELCGSLNRKLGGPVMPSPPRSKPKKLRTVEAAGKPKAKPGAVTKRPAAPKLSRTLDRVLSKESERHRRSMSRGPSSMIALMRSASTPTLPIVKRETSDSISLMSMANRDSQDSANSKVKTLGSSTLGPAKRITQEERARRDAEVKAELQEAISGLRRPNRDVVGKAMAEAAERRASTSLSQLRKSKKPTQHPSFQNIVKATPVGPRFRDALNRDADSHLNTNTTYMKSTNANHVPPSSGLVPSSAPRKRDRDAAFLVEESSPALPSFQAPTGVIDATPGRPALKRNFLSAPGPDEGVVLASSPVMSRKFLAVPNSSLKHRDSGIGLPSSPGGWGLAETPIKPSRIGGMGSLEGYVTVTPVKRRVADHIVATPARPNPDMGVEKEATRKMSIYERLGWDDDFDDLA